MSCWRSCTRSRRPYLLDRPFELHTDNASLQWLQQQRHVSHYQARWFNLLAEYQFRVVHIQGRTNPADFLTRKRLPDGPGPASHTGYDEPDSALELFTAAGAAPETAFVTVSAAEESPRFEMQEYVRTCPTCQRVKADYLPTAGLLFPSLSPRAVVGASASNSSQKVSL